jgi:hypothetical protein
MCVCMCVYVCVGIHSSSNIGRSELDARTAFKAYVQECVCVCVCARARAQIFIRFIVT